MINSKIATLGGVVGKWRTVTQPRELQGATHIRMSDADAGWHYQCKLRFSIEHINWKRFQGFFPLSTEHAKAQGGDGKGVNK